MSPLEKASEAKINNNGERGLPASSPSWPKKATGLAINENRHMSTFQIIEYIPDKAAVKPHLGKKLN